MNLLEIQKGVSAKASEISELRFLEGISAFAKNSYETVRKNPLYADLGSDEFAKIDPKDLKTTSNFWVDKIVAEHQGWRKFPDRISCLKVYNTVEQAGDGQDVHVIIPFDRARVGVCSRGSFYKSFKEAQADLNLTSVDNDALTNWIQNVKSGLTKLIPDDVKKLKEAQPETYAQFKSNLADIDESLKSDVHIRLMRAYQKENELTDDEKLALKRLVHTGSTMSIIKNDFDPEGNGFKAPMIESYSNPEGSVALWLDKQCLGVRLDKYLDLLKRGKLK